MCSGQLGYARFSRRRREDEKKCFADSRNTVCYSQSDDAALFERAKLESKWPSGTSR